jgi:GNAT superfamily N-acetyltransferase
MGDVVGHLVETGPLVRVRSSDGAIHDCRHSDVLYVRRLTDRPVKNSAIRSVEHAAALAWPGREHQWLDGWMLRATPGAGLEANSAVPLDMFAHTNTVPAIIDWYAQRGLPPCLAVPERLLRLPEDIPTRYETRTLVRELPGGAPAGDVVLAAEPDAGWLASSGEAVEPVDALTAVSDGEVVFASIPGVAVGRAAVTEAPDGTRWLGASALRVSDDRRRQGHGRAICAALQSWGFDRGATRGYAQVPSDDAGAFAFCEAVGFAGQHRTRYLDARLLS